MQKYFDSSKKLYQIAWQSSKGGVWLAVQGWLDMAKADLGKKRACLACGMRFYDFNRSPIVCPGCGAEFDPENIIKSRKGRSAAKPMSRDNVDATEADQIEDDDAAELTDAVVDQNDDDEIDFDDDNDVDVDDDGPGIIQDDISDDELLPSLDDKNES